MWMLFSLITASNTGTKNCTKKQGPRGQCETLNKTILSFRHNLEKDQVLTRLITSVKRFRCRVIKRAVTTLCCNDG